MQPVIDSWYGYIYTKNESEYALEERIT